MNDRAQRPGQKKGRQKQREMVILWGNGDDKFHFQMAAETIQDRVEVGGSRQHFATLRPEARNMFKGKPVELEDWPEAVHIYMALHGQTDDKTMYMVVCPFLSADVKTWMKTLYIDS
jgi:hypothetical protein